MLCWWSIRISVAPLTRPVKFWANLGIFCELFTDWAAIGLTDRAVNDGASFTYTTIPRCEDVMLTQGTSFVRYSKLLCWIVALIWFSLSFLSFTSDSESSTINGFLWLVGAIAFAVSAGFISKSSDLAESEDLEE
jgi:hypothetical protein